LALYRRHPRGREDHGGKLIGIRSASEDDMAALIDFDSHAALHAARAEEIRRWVLDRECQLAELAGRPVGYVVVTRSFFHRTFIEMLMVATAVRRQGVGARLLAHVCASHSEEQVWTSVNRSNLPMQALLAKAGFRRSGIIENLDPDDPELIFVHRPVREAPEES
jgi:ribosomal protein S18 acetylase RimI-like enzyme